MGKIVVSENVSLDGVLEDPTGDDGFEHGGWFNEISDTDRAEWGKASLDEALAAEVLLMGRRSDEYFAARWLPRTGEWADRLNTMPKYVVSSTVEEAQWTNATVLRGDVADEIARLKDAVDGEILVIASGRLVAALLEHDLVDELRLKVYPVVLGSGERVFSADKKRLRLLNVRPLGDSLTFVSYAVARDA